MTLTIELPESVAEQASRWSQEALSEIAVQAVVHRLLEDREDTGFIGEISDVTEDLPMDEETRVALKEARADYDAGRYCTLEELDTRLDALLADWKATKKVR